MWVSVGRPAFKDQDAVCFIHNCTLYFAPYISPTPATENTGRKSRLFWGSPWWRVAPTEFDGNTPCLWHAKAAQQYKGNESRSVESPSDNSQTSCRQPFASHFRLSQEREMPGWVKIFDSARPRLGMQNTRRSLLDRAGCTAFASWPNNRNPHWRPGCR